MKNTIASFWLKVEKGDHCWGWKDAARVNGYGQFTIDGRKHLAHRFAYELDNGPIPAGYEVDHICHNRECVRPSHLRAVSKFSNAQNRAGANSNSKSGVRGVYAAKNGWRAVVTLDRKPRHIGYFDSLEAAANAVSAWRSAHMPYSEMDRNR